MKPRTLAAALLLIAAPLGAAEPTDGVDAQQLTAACGACHGADGISTNPDWPSIAGQNSNYLHDQLVAIRDGSRSAPLMAGQLTGMDDATLRTIADHYAMQTARRGEADPDRVLAGERIYRGGDKNTGVPACIACHGPRGEGNAPAGWPSIAGQHAAYIATQLRAYAAGDRTTDAEQIMRNVAAVMTAEQIEAVATYAEGLE